MILLKSHKHCNFWNDLNLKELSNTVLKVYFCRGNNLVVSGKLRGKINLGKINLGIGPGWFKIFEFLNVRVFFII